MTNPGKSLLAHALRHPGTEVGVACAGTALEKSTVRVRGKAFLFLGTTSAMVKLRDSLAEAARLEARAPDRIKVGASGWVTVQFDAGTPLPKGVLESWIDESHALFAGPVAATKKKGTKQQGKGAPRKRAGK